MTVVALGDSLANPSLYIKGTRADGRNIYELHAGNGNYISLRKWCSQFKVNYYAIARDLRYAREPEKFWRESLLPRHLERRRKRIEKRGRAEAKSLRAAGAYDHADTDSGMRERMLEAIAQLQLAGSPFGGLPRSVKIEVLEALLRGNVSHRAAGGPSQRDEVSKQIIKVRGRYEQQLRDVKKRLQAAKSLQMPYPCELDNQIPGSPLAKRPWGIDP